MPVTLVEINLEIICLYMTDMYRNTHIHTHTKKRNKVSFTSEYLREVGL